MIELIYSRRKNRRIRDLQKVIKISTILIIAVITSKEIIKTINCIIDAECKNTAKVLATMVSNKEASKVLENYKYNDFSEISYDENKNVKFINYNIINLNKVCSDIAEQVQQSLIDTRSSSFQIALGSFTGFKILSGRGPRISVKISNIGNIETKIQSYFYASGINQTVHRIYLELKCNCIILTPYSTIEEQITNQIILAETVIVGEIPETYYHIDSLSSDNLLDVLN